MGSSCMGVRGGVGAGIGEGCGALCVGGALAGARAIPKVSARSCQLAFGAGRINTLDNVPLDGSGARGGGGASGGGGGTAVGEMPSSEARDSQALFFVESDIGYRIVLWGGAS